MGGIFLPIALFDKEMTMTRTTGLLSLLFLGGALAATGCEDKVCKESLSKATAAKAEILKSAEAMHNEITDLKAKLAATEKNLEAAEKAVDEANVYVGLRNFPWVTVSSAKSWSEVSDRMISKYEEILAQPLPAAF